MYTNLKTKTVFVILISLLVACKDDSNTSDAYGNFDVDETIISAEAAGVLMDFSIKEGAIIKAGQVVGHIDSTNLILERKSIQANKSTVTAKITAINAEIKVLNTQKEIVEKEHKRIKKLIASDAATPKQLDDIEGNLEIIKSRIIAANAQKPAVRAQLEVIDANIAKINNRLAKCIITNYIDGVVLTKLAEAHELVGPGKPLYKVANPNKIYLKAYVTGTQLPSLKLGQQVSLLIDNASGELTTINGVINWISEEAEFTPKLIQTREERVSLVYAIKIGFENDGTVKIGMPGEVKF